MCNQAFPYLPPSSVLREKSLTIANGQRGQTEEEVDCRRGEEKKSQPRGVELDGLGH